MQAKSRNAVALMLAGAFCFAPWYAYSQQPEAEMPRRSDIVVGVNVVIAPTTVIDKRTGQLVSGLQIPDFRLYDNDQVQRINADIGTQPISLVVAIQANNIMDSMLPKIQKIGSMLGSLVLGENGEAALVKFDSKAETVQEFTSDSGAISESLQKIKAGRSSSALVDAVTYSVRLLKNRPQDRRRIILLISERRDNGSEGRLRDALDSAQLANVVVYSVDISRFLANAEHKAEPPRPNPIPTTANPMPPGAAVTPTTVDIQRNAGNVIPLITEVFKSVKGKFSGNPVDILTAYTGGREFAFARQRGLEQAISAIGEEVHSQYLLSYSPSNLKDGGFHSIRVEVLRPNYEVRTRTGYWVAARP